MQLRDMFGTPIPLSGNQIEFLRQVQDQGFEPRTYSGRGMMGATCPAVHVDRAGDIRLQCAYCTDAMGLGMVLYAKY